MICKTISTYFTGTEQTSRKSHGLSFAHFWTYYILTCSNDKEKIPNTVAPCWHRRGAVGYNHHSSTTTHYANQNLRIIQKLGENPIFMCILSWWDFKKKMKYLSSLATISSILDNPCLYAILLYLNTIWCLN